MDTDTTTVTGTATLETPSFIRRIPVKKIAVVTLVVAGALALAKYAKDNGDLDVDAVTDTVTA